MGRRLGVSREWISKIERGHKEMGELIQLKLQQIEHTLAGQGAAASVKPGHTATGIPSNARIVPVTDNLRTIPVLSWAHAGHAGTYEQIAEHEQEQILTASTDPKAFAVTVEGESMMPGFMPGDLVIVAPSRLPRNGRPVVAKLADDGVLLRLFHRVDARTIRLTSLNPDIYPPTDLKAGDYRWCWPVEEQIRRHY